ncbi:MAG: TIM barrel protein [Armatimonadota bacterium]
MRLGLCCSPEQAPIALEAGFDYVELPAHLLLGFGHKPFGDLPAETTNLFFDGSVNLFENRFVTDIVSRTVNRAAEAGVQVMAIGSGAQRRAPEGVDAKTGLDTFLKVAETAQRYASRHDIVIAPESLNRLETNVGNDLPELAHALREIGIGFTLDTYHVVYEAEGKPVDWEQQVPFCPSHVHFGYRSLQALDGKESQRVADRLKALGYDKRVSYEGPGEDRGLPAILAVMKATFCS